MKYDLSAGDDCALDRNYISFLYFNFLPVKEGNVISIKSALPSMECSTRQSGETICKNSEKGIEREFKGFEQCKLTGSPRYEGHLHDGSIEKCSEFTFDKTPVVCPGDEENCSVIILSKETRGKYRNFLT
ncbi:MAG: hypothetical protein LE178_02660, partial [Endomicrobium sp.]|nr:hypothetical protein [Endomicrobium sp.]